MVSYSFHLNVWFFQLPPVFFQNQGEDLRRFFVVGDRPWCVSAWLPMTRCGSDLGNSENGGLKPQQTRKWCFFPTENHHDLGVFWLGGNHPLKERPKLPSGRLRTKMVMENEGFEDVIPYWTWGFSSQRPVGLQEFYQFFWRDQTWCKCCW